MELYKRLLDALNEYEIVSKTESYEDAINQIAYNLKNNNKEKADYLKSSHLKYELLNSYKVKISKKFMNNIKIPTEFDKSQLDLYIPFDNVFITFENDKMKDMYVLIQRLKEKISGTDAFNISIFEMKGGIDTFEHISDFLFTYSKAPRIYMSCKHVEKCKYRNLSHINLNSTYNGDDLPAGCMKTYRTKDLCYNNLESVFMIFMVVKHAFDKFRDRDIINKIKGVIGRLKELQDKNLKKNNPLKNKELPKAKGDTENYVYISDNVNFRKYGSNNIKSDIKGSEKSQHIRREHLRHLKSGKVVKVRQSIVKEGFEKTNYKV